MGKHFEKIMTEMCDRVGADWKKIDPKKSNWFHEFSWTIKEEDKFAEWMVDYLYKNSEARKEVLTINTKSKNMISRAVLNFLFNYGWKIK